MGSEQEDYTQEVKLSRHALNFYRTTNIASGWRGLSVKISVEFCASSLVLVPICVMVVVNVSVFIVEIFAT